MRTVGIIAEYNPFHTGHAYHLKKAKEESAANYAILVMSPDFVQRGTPALFDKLTRTQMALQNGADLVLELPVCYATGSAEYFAGGAVALLDSLGIVDTLCFGSESDDIRLFHLIAEFLCAEPESYVRKLRKRLKKGETYPQARCAALSECLAPGASDFDSSAREAQVSRDTASSGQKLFADFLSRPNNILGIEYCKALQKRKSPIRALPVRRLGSSYSSTSMNGSYCSAAAIRSAIRSGSTFDKNLLSYLPENCRDLFLPAARQTLCADDFMPCLTASLLANDSFDQILDISPELSDRILSLRFSCIGKSFDETVALLKTKQLTEARIRRALLHLILSLRQEQVEAFLQDGAVYYAKVLGFRRDASALLHAIKENCAVPFITKNAQAKTMTKPCAKEMWERDLFASHLYRGLHSGKYHVPFRTEYEISPVIV